MLLIELLILVILLLIFGALCFGAGYFVAKHKKKQKVKREAEPLTPLDLAKKEQMQKEMENFWSYDGSEQLDSNTNVLNK